MGLENKKTGALSDTNKVKAFIVQDEHGVRSGLISQSSHLEAAATLPPFPQA